ncbi:MAG: intracellular proteinase inhibitor [Bacillota bacterium]|nr:intracellular proteinase inhibitor [Bacillota bacterium]
MLNFFLVLLLMHPFPTMSGEFIHDVKVAGSRGHYIITGETGPSIGNLYFSAEDGHNELINEKHLFLKNKEQSFKIKIAIPESKLPENGTVLLNLLVRNDKGEIVHSYPIILERFYH